MTILLIDKSGHKRQMEIPHDLDVVLVPIPTLFTVTWQEQAVYEPLWIAEFVRTTEPSWPTVYRQR